jgi:hypothetical protein
MQHLQTGELGYGCLSNMEGQKLTSLYFVSAWLTVDD